MINGQLELGFDKARGWRRLDRRQRHLNRANWWFERMRHVVDRAFDWQPAPVPRPEQIWFAPARGEAGFVSPSLTVPGQDERQICE